MLDLNKIVNNEIEKAYLKGRKDAASELRDILSVSYTHLTLPTT